MKKISVFLLFFVAFKSNAQFPFSTCSPKKISDFPGKVWAIDGKIDDWKNILGTETGDPIWPFGASLGDNAYYEPYGNNDPDHPDPQTDLRVLSTIHDNKNVFFYFRQLNKTSQPNRIYYFLDANLTGALERGEPVISVSFNSHTIIKVSLCEYIPGHQDFDFIAACGGVVSSNFIIDTLPGTVKEKINSSNAQLLPGEIFSAALTEDGMGVELAVPWRLIAPTPYRSFGYRVALQKNQTYNADKPMDIASCNGKVEVINPPIDSVAITNTSIVPITSGVSYRIDITAKNPTNVSFDAYMSIVIAIAPSLPVSITYNGSNFNLDGQTKIHLGMLDAFSTKTYSFILNVQGGPFQNAGVFFTPSFFWYSYYNRCDGNCCGKPINPIGLELGDETTTGAGRNKTIESESTSQIENRIRVYPNPSSGNFNINLPGTEFPLELTLTDYTGKLVRKWSGVRQSLFRVENLKQGFYLLTIRNKEGRLLGVKKLISQ